MIYEIIEVWSRSIVQLMNKICSAEINVLPTILHCLLGWFFFLQIFALSAHEQTLIGQFPLLYWIFFAFFFSRCCRCCPKSGPWFCHINWSKNRFHRHCHSVNVTRGDATSICIADINFDTSGKVIRLKFLTCRDCCLHTDRIPYRKQFSIVYCFIYLTLCTDHLKRCCDNDST